MAIIHSNWERTFTYFIFLFYSFPLNKFKNPLLNIHIKSFSGASAGKNLPAMQETQEMQVWSLDWEDTLVKCTATHSSILAKKNPMDRGAWRAKVHWVTKSQTCLKWPRPHCSVMTKSSDQFFLFHRKKIFAYKIC